MAGACTVEFSIHLKSAGLELQLESSRPSAMLASRAYADPLFEAMRLLERPPRIIWLEDYPGTTVASQFSLNALLRSSRSFPDPAEHLLDDALTISYTSGTTGAPKGVVMSHRYFWVGAKNARILSDARRDDTYFMWEPFYHIAAWMTVMMALHHGLRIFMVDRFSASKLWAQIGEAGATKLHYLGGLINIILSQPKTVDEVDSPVRIAWGAACPSDSWRAFEQRFQLEVREGYGISEGQNFTHLNLDGVVGSIGKSVDEFDTWIADERGHPVEAGVVGEIVLKPRAPGIAMTGYFDEPDKTKEVLRDDGCVYTGDLATHDGDGNFYFRGRKKDAMRRSGENVSAWEVERVVNQAPGVEESAVIGVDSRMGEQEIAAFIKLERDAMADPARVIAFCNARLAHYQVPRYLQFVEELPRGPTQRVRKSDLRIDLESAWDRLSADSKPPPTL